MASMASDNTSISPYQLRFINLKDDMYQQERKLRDEVRLLISLSVHPLW